MDKSQATPTIQVCTETLWWDLLTTLTPLLRIALLVLALYLAVLVGSHDGKRNQSGVGMTVGVVLTVILMVALLAVVPVAVAVVEYLIARQPMNDASDFLRFHACAKGVFEVATRRPIAWQACATTTASASHVWYYG